MKKTKFGISILHFNNLCTIDCLRSILKCNYQEIKIFILDNGSDNNSLKKINLFIDSIKTHKIEIVTFRSNINKGFTEGHNYLIRKLIKKDIEKILLLNSDCIVPINFFKNTNIFLDKKNSPIEFYCFPNIENKSGIKTFYKKWNSYFGTWEKINRFNPNVDYHSRGHLLFPNGAGMMFNKLFFKRIGFLDKSLFFYGDEIDLSIRSMKKNVYFQVITNTYMLHHVSQSAGEGRSLFKDYHSNRSKILLFHKYFPSRIFLARFYVLLIAIKRLITFNFESFVCLAKLSFSSVYNIKLKRIL